MSSSKKKLKVRYKEYPKAIDLTGRDLIGLLEQEKYKVESLVGRLANKSEMPIVELSSSKYTSMTGEFPDEVHELPNASLRPDFSHLILHFRDDHLIGFQWTSQQLKEAAQNRPWYRRLFGRR